MLLPPPLRGHKLYRERLSEGIEGMPFKRTLILYFCIYSIFQNGLIVIHIIVEIWKKSQASNERVRREKTSYSNLFPCEMCTRTCFEVEKECNSDTTWRGLFVCDICFISISSISD